MVPGGLSRFAGGDRCHDRPPGGATGDDPFNEAAGRRASVHTSGKRTEVLTRVFIDADRAREQVPDGFTVSGINGRAQLRVFVEDCETSVDGGEPSRSIVSGVTIILDAVQCRAG